MHFKEIFYAIILVQTLLPAHPVSKKPTWTVPLLDRALPLYCSSMLEFCVLLFVVEAVSVSVSASASGFTNSETFTLPPKIEVYE